MMTSISFVFQAVWMLLTNLCSKMSIDEYQNYSHVTIICLKCYAVKVSEEYDQDRGVLFRIVLFLCHWAPWRGRAFISCFMDSTSMEPKVKNVLNNSQKTFSKRKSNLFVPRVDAWKHYFAVNLIFYILWKKTKSGRHIVSYHIPETLGIKYSSKPPPPKIPALFRCIKRL